MEYRCDQCDYKAPTISMGLQHNNLVHPPIFTQMVIITYITYFYYYC